MSKGKQRCLLILFMVAIGGVVSGCSSDDAEGEDLVELIISGGLNRSFSAYVPATYEGDQAAPLLFAFHGVPGSGEGMRRQTSLDDLADRLGGIVVYPNATADWAEGCDGCARADRDSVDDVQFAQDLITYLAARFFVDTRRVYAIGYSQGGLFTQRLACDFADGLAAVVVVAATMSEPLSETCTPQQAVSVMMVHGKSDPVFPWEGQSQGSFSTLAAREAAALWAEKDDCTVPGQRTNGPDGTEGAEVDLEAFSGCADGAEVLLYGITDGSHDWPQSFDINSLIGDFLSRHTR